MDTLNKLLMTAFVTLLPSVVFAEGDRFYNSTWYAGSSPELAWTGRSVLSFDSGSTPVLFQSVGQMSPRFYHPGFGYVSPQCGLSTQGNYAFGMQQPSPLFGIYPNTNAGSSTIGSLHRPWYLPGSPGN